MRYLTKLDVWVFHLLAVQQTADNIENSNTYRNELLDSAVELIKHDKYYPDLFTKAAALTRSLVLNHPFIDGNKRAAAFSLMAFLEENDYRLTCTNHEVVELTLKIANGEIREIREIREWIAKRSNPSDLVDIHSGTVISRLKKFFFPKKS